MPIRQLLNLFFHLLLFLCLNSEDIAAYHCWNYCPALQDNRFFFFFFTKSKDAHFGIKKRLFYQEKPISTTEAMSEYPMLL